MLIMLCSGVASLIRIGDGQRASQVVAYSDVSD